MREYKDTTDNFFLLMKFVDTATAQGSIPKALAGNSWAIEILEKLKTNNLSSRDRIRYKDALAQKIIQKWDNEAYEEDLRKMQQQAEAAEQRAEAAEQRVEVAEQKISSAIKELLRQGTFTDDNIAQLFDVDVEYVRQMKDGLES